MFRYRHYLQAVKFFWLVKSILLDYLRTEIYMICLAYIKALLETSIIDTYLETKNSV